ncbi:uncharacterized protein LOC143029287 [Oratosquilla oratoria]|uniref:uncharacterized protein LOC143029287 n=1 Tax=Oratosquilla oratoria TaxID=337810 RepID=UPI003F77163D
MGDGSAGCRGFDTPTLGTDLWPMNFDMDLTLESPSARKGATSGLGTGPLGTAALGPPGGTSGSAVSNTYGDMQQISSSISSILQRIDDLHPGDISQMTDLTNSLPKSDSDAAQNILAKLTCHDLGAELASGPDTGHKGLDSTLFGPATSADVPQVSGASGESVMETHKSPMEPTDVYGRVSCYEGKLVLQLRHVNLHTNYSLNVTECWLCGEKVGKASQIFCHKHFLNGSFQVNDGYVQMEIDNYIMPDQVLDPPESSDLGGNGGIAPNVMTHSAPSLPQDLANSRDLALTGNLGSGTDALGMGAATANIQYPQTSATAVGSAANLGVPMSSHQQHCLTTTFNPIQIPGMPLSTSDLSLTSSSVSSCTTSGNACPTGMLVGSTANCLPAPSVSQSLSTHRAKDLTNKNSCALPSYSMVNPRSSMCSNGSTSMQPTYECSSSTPTHQRHLMQHLAFSNTDQVSTTQDSISEAKVSSITSLDSIPRTSLSDSVQKLPDPPRRAETGARKRKSRAQKKPSVIQMKEEVVTMVKEEVLSMEDVKAFQSSSDQRHFNRPDAAFDDWIRQNLPEEELDVPDGQFKLPKRDMEKLTKVQENHGNSESLVPFPKKIPENQRPKEPDQTSRLAAVMLSKGIDAICRFCQKEFGKNIRKYKTHMKDKHGTAEEDMFPCTFCSKKFSKGKHYLQHLHTHVTTRRFTCRLCGTSYSREDKLRRHMTNHSQEKPFSCSGCPKTFKRKDYLEAHQRVHSGKKCKCDICGYMCSSQFNLEYHIKLHNNDKSFKCDLCEKAFIRRDQLEKHIENIHQNKKLKCDVCGKLFTRKDVLKRHAEVHSNQTYKCDMCDKKFSRKDKLTSHLKVHKDKAAHKCSICPARFVRKDVLTKHEKLHTTKEQCHVCSKFLPTKERLEGHLKWHEKQLLVAKDKIEDRKFVCEDCSKSFTTKDCLRRHMRKVHGKILDLPKRGDSSEHDKRFFCDICSKGFTRSCNLRTHLVKAHSKDLEEEDFDLPSVLQSTKLNLPLGNLTGTVVSSAASHNIPSYGASGWGGAGMGGGGVGSMVPSSSALAFSASHHQLPPPLSLGPPSQFTPSSSPDSPINLTTDTITAAAYLLAYPSYQGPYQ